MRNQEGNLFYKVNWRTEQAASPQGNYSALQLPFNKIITVLRPLKRWSIINNVHNNFKEMGMEGWSDLSWYLQMDKSHNQKQWIENPPLQYRPTTTLHYQVISHSSRCSSYQFMMQTISGPIRLIISNIAQRTDYQ